MTECRHAHILLVFQSTDRLRCRHCHLTLKESELTDGYCPECMETSGRKRYDFERLASGEEKVLYRCEDCGALLAPPG